jgi:hypothetical protein
MFEYLFPCIAFVTVLLVVFGFLAYNRYLRHKEIMLLAEKGLPYPQVSTGNGHAALRWGIVITAIGMALLIGLAPAALSGRWSILLLALVPTFFGLSLTLIYVLTRKEQPKEQPKEEKPVEEQGGGDKG